MVTVNSTHYKREFSVRVILYNKTAGVSMGVKIEITNWGQIGSGDPVKLVSLTSEAGFQVGLLSLGATIRSVVYPGDGEEKGRKRRPPLDGDAEGSESERTRMR